MFWAAGLSLSRYHAERGTCPQTLRRVTPFWEQFGRAARLWTNGYDSVASSSLRSDSRKVAHSLEDWRFSRRSFSALAFLALRRSSEHGAQTRGRDSVRIERTNGRANVRKRRYSAHRGCSIRRGQGLGSVLEKREAFDLTLIMAGTSHLAMEVAHCMVLHSIQALHAECQMGGVRT